jgi:hypothetical protein
MGARLSSAKLPGSIRAGALKFFLWSMMNLPEVEGRRDVGFSLKSVFSFSKAMKYLKQLPGQLAAIHVERHLLF